MTTSRTVALTHARLQELLHYDPETGVFTWRVSRGPVRAGSKAGSVSSGGYIQIDIDGKTYGAHRLACFYVSGKYPDYEVDHKDGNPSRNPFSNLRPATHSQNSKNRKLNQNSSLRTKGVTKNHKGYKARIQVNGLRIHLGTFKTKEEAAAAYATAAQKYFGEFARV